MDTGQA